MKVYKVIIHDDNFKETKYVQAEDISKVAPLAKDYFSDKYSTHPDNIKVSLHPADTSEHIDEIFEFLHR